MSTKLIARVSGSQTNAAMIGESKLSPVYWRVIEKEYEAEVKEKSLARLKIPAGKGLDGNPRFVYETEFECSQIDYDLFEEAIKAGKTPKYKNKPIKDIDRTSTLPEYVNMDAVMVPGSDTNDMTQGYRPEGNTAIEPDSAEPTPPGGAKSVRGAKRK